MKTRLLAYSTLCVIFLSLPGPLRAHHGNAAYDTDHLITIKGTVTEFVFSNPHCQFYLNVTDPSGKVVMWSVESQSPAILHRNGWTRESLKAGDLIEVTLAPAKNGSPVGFSGGGTGKVVLPDGHVLRMNLR